MMEEVMGNTIKLPPIKELFSRSWDTFTASLLHLFLFTVIMAVFMILYVLLGIILGVLVFFITSHGLMPSLSQMGMSAFSSLPIPIYLLLAVLFFAFIIGMIIISSMGSIVPVLIVSKYPGNVSLKSEMKVSISLVIPLLATQFIVSFISIGGAFLFILPAILFSFLFMFVNYEVILGKQKLAQAIKRSAFIVSRHFGEILVRILLYALIYILLVVFIPNLITKIEPKTGILINILSVLVNVLIGWFGLCFGITLYKQSKVGLENETGGSILWIWIVSLLGWVVLFVVIFAGVKILSSDGAKSFVQDLNSKSKSSNNPFDLQNTGRFEGKDIGILKPPSSNLSVQ
ncbi:hypothetical protein HY029_05145 [Candidatus Gottesmanbacteria bacterium]|nr:hypothetical protein [Candidatus Gottesmanbacteria bacterium]